MFTLKKPSRYTIVVHRFISVITHFASVFHVLLKDEVINTMVYKMFAEKPYFILFMSLLLMHCASLNG